jgi:hypothetical protein
VGWTRVRLRGDFKRVKEGFLCNREERAASYEAASYEVSENCLATELVGYLRAVLYRGSCEL